MLHIWSDKKHSHFCCKDMDYKIHFKKHASYFENWFRYVMKQQLFIQERVTWCWFWKCSTFRKCCIPTGRMKGSLFTWIQIKQVQNPDSSTFFLPIKTTYMRHFHSIAVAQILHFAHSHGEKQNQDFVSHCKYLHKQFLSWQTPLPTLVTDKKKSSWYLPSPIPLSDCLHIMNDDFYSTYIWCTSL